MRDPWKHMEKEWLRMTWVELQQQGPNSSNQQFGGIQRRKNLPVDLTIRTNFDPQIDINWGMLQTDLT